MKKFDMTNQALIDSMNDHISVFVDSDYFRSYTNKLRTDDYSMYILGDNIDACKKNKNVVMSLNTYNLGYEIKIEIHASCVRGALETYNNLIDVFDKIPTDVKLTSFLVRLSSGYNQSDCDSIFRKIIKSYGEWQKENEDANYLEYKKQLLKDNFKINEKNENSCIFTNIYNFFTGKKL